MQRTFFDALALEFFERGWTIIIASFSFFLLFFQGCTIFCANVLVSYIIIVGAFRNTKLTLHHKLVLKAFAHTYSTELDKLFFFRASIYASFITFWNISVFGALLNAKLLISVFSIMIKSKRTLSYTGPLKYIKRLYITNYLIVCIDIISLFFSSEIFNFFPIFTFPLGNNN